MIHSNVSNWNRSTETSFSSCSNICRVTTNHHYWHYLPCWQMGSGDKQSVSHDLKLVTVCSETSGSSLILAHSHQGVSLLIAGVTMNVFHRFHTKWCLIYCSSREDEAFFDIWKCFQKCPCIMKSNSWLRFISSSRRSVLLCNKGKFADCKKKTMLLKFLVNWWCHHICVASGDEREIVLKSKAPASFFLFHPNALQYCSLLLCK